MQTGRCCKCSCDVRWTPNDETDREIQITGSVTILNNPIMDETTEPFAMALDALPVGPIAMGGGDANFGPDTADQGLGYYGLNSQRVRLHRFCEWNPPLTSFEFDSPAGTFDFDSDLGKPYGTPSATVTPLAFAPTKNVEKHCVWNGNKLYQIFNVQTQLLGDAPTEDYQTTIVFDDVCMYPGFLICDKIRVWTGTSGTRRAVIYNSAIGYLPTAILGVPISSFDFSEFAGGASPTYLTTTSYRDHLSGRSLGDGTADTYSNDFNSNSGNRLLDVRIRQRVFPTGTSDFLFNTGVFDVGRTVMTAVVLGTQPKFDNGTWIIEVSPRIEFMTRYRHFVTPSFASASWEYGDAIYPPNVTEADVGEFTDDYADFSNTDETKGVFAYYHGIPSGMADGTHDFDPPTAYELSLLTPFPCTYPWWLGIETLTLDLHVESTGHSSFSEEDGFVDASERYDSNYSEILTLTSLSGNVGNNFSISIKPVVTGYSYEMAVTDRAAYRDDTDPVVFTMVAADPVTATFTITTSMAFSVIDDLTVASAGTAEEFSVDFDTPGTGELTRKLI